MKLRGQSIHTIIRVASLLIFLVACTKKVDYVPTYTWSSVEVNAELEGAEDIEKIVAPYRIRLDSIMDEVIGYASHDLTTKGQYESTLGTFVTRLLKEQSASIFQQDVDVAIMNHHGGLRAPINEGVITLGDVFEVMPFENDVVLLEITGDSLLQVIRFIGQSGRSMI